MDTEYKKSPTYERWHIYMKHEILTASRHIPVIKNSVMLCWLKNTNTWLNQAPPMDVMAKRTASSLKWATIAPNCPAGCTVAIKWRENNRPNTSEKRQKTQMMWNQFFTQLSWWWRWVPYGIQPKEPSKEMKKYCPNSCLISKNMDSTLLWEVRSRWTWHLQWQKQYNSGWHSL